MSASMDALVQKFQSFWFGDNISPYQRLVMKSFVDFSHQYILYAYRKFDVPAGVELRDAAEILPESRVFFYGEKAGMGRGSVAAFSNLFRYHLLHRLGGWWVDADVVCLSESVPAGEIFMGWESENLIGTAILRFPKRHGLVRKLCEITEDAGTDVEWAETGPTLLTRVAREHELLGLVVPQSQCYPLQPIDALQQFIPAYREKTRAKIRTTPFLHMWNEILRRAVVLGSMAPPPGSLIADLFERHGIGFDNAPAYTADQIQRLNDNCHAYIHWEWEEKQRGVREAQRAAEQAEMRRLEETLQRERAEMQQLEEKLQREQTRADRLAREIEHHCRQVDALRSSTSWRVTAPVRRLANLLRWRTLI